MIVTFYCLEDGKTVTLGTISMKEGQLVASPPDEVALRNVLNDVVRVDRGSDPPLILNAIDHPTEFLEHLPKEYHGSYFWAKAIPD